MRKSLGDKRREIPQRQAAEILTIHHAGAEDEHSKLFPTTHFGYRKITVERPLRLNFQASPSGSLGSTRTGFSQPGGEQEEAGEQGGRSRRGAGKAEQQEAIRTMLETLPGKFLKDRAELREAPRRCRSERPA